MGLNMFRGLMGLMGIDLVFRGLSFGLMGFTWGLMGLGVRLNGVYGLELGFLLDVVV